MHASEPAEHVFGGELVATREGVKEDLPSLSASGAVGEPEGCVVRGLYETHCDEIVGVPAGLDDEVDDERSLGGTLGEAAPLDPGLQDVHELAGERDFRVAAAVVRIEQAVADVVPDEDQSVLDVWRVLGLFKLHGGSLH